MFKGFKGTRPAVMRDEGTRLDVFYCTCCGLSEHREAITLRTFDAGYSACCAAVMCREVVNPAPQTERTKCKSERCARHLHATG